MLSCLTSLLLAAAASPQAPDAATEQPVAGRLGDREITVAEYQEFLWQRFGRRALRQYADLLLLRAEAEAFGITVAGDELDQTVAERIRSMQGETSDAEFAVQLRRSDMDLAGLSSGMRLESEQELLASRLILATRVATDAKLEAAFTERYGIDGVMVEVAHILVMPNFLRAEKLRAGASPQDIDLDALKVEARERAEAALAELRAGASFEELVVQYSHDQSTRDQKGQLSAWRPGLYGLDFSAAVAATAAGDVAMRVVESGAGYHLIRVTKRQKTHFEDVRAALVDQVMQAEPHWQEKEALLAGLRSRTPLELP